MSFSGGQTHQFIVTDLAVIKEITNLLGQLPIHPALKGKDWLYPREHIGYRGFRVRNLSTFATNIKGFSVFESNVEVVRDGATAKEFRLDADAAIERRLVQSLEASGHIITRRGVEESVRKHALNVSVLVFSGRPNPSFVITDSAVIEEITDALKQLPAHPTLRDNASIGQPGQLGYRGFRVENTSMFATDIASFSVYRSDVEVLKPGAIIKEFHVDAAAAIERRLIELAETRNIMAENVLAHIKDQANR